ncbi:MAG: metallopeptidase family protein [Anaerolineae bacterium]|nr:metallopeptidase family protein [Thermoflexus sp.]MDW8064730.1 metallopeptidase family protein [Anaerolineae bacterium]
MRRRRIRITSKLIERIWTEIYAALPGDLQRAVDNIVILLEEEPTPEQRQALGLPPEESLYGMFEGPTLAERDQAFMPWPSRILIFRRPLEADFGNDPFRLRAEIRRTLLHELGHYFGLSEEALIELGLE